MVMGTCKFLGVRNFAGGRTGDDFDRPIIPWWTCSLFKEGHPSGSEPLLRNLCTQEATESWELAGSEPVPGATWELTPESLGPCR